VQLYETLPGAITYSLHQESIEDRRIGKLYYLFKGRNAWHSTWINRYSDGCMHTSLVAAKKSAEKQRKSGTRFFIQELPVLILAAQENVLLVTQINCENVLLNYHPDGAMRYRDNDELKSCNIDLFSPLNAAYDTFWVHSDYWDVRPPTSNSIIRFVLPREQAELEPYDGNKSQLYTSFSFGTNYHLGWSAAKDRDRSTHIEHVLSIS